MALIKEVAVEMIAARTAHPANAVIHGFVIFAIMAINTLLPSGVSKPEFRANVPKKTGITHMRNVPNPAKRVAFETILDEAPAKHL